jgi:O-acetyl-ADP-ribose deacetylase (regulator of RNase III)
MTGMAEVLATRSIGEARDVQLVRGDITLEATDAIVNAANAHLMHGGGVAGAIVGRGGAAIQHESNAWVGAHGPVTHGRPAWTSGGNLAARFVIHAVGPIWGEGEEDSKLEATVRGALRVAEELNLRSIALPAIATGIFGFPKDRAANIILRAIRDHLRVETSRLELVRLVLIDEATISAFRVAWEHLR